MTIYPSEKKIEKRGFDYKFKYVTNKKRKLCCCYTVLLERVAMKLYRQSDVIVSDVHS